MEINGQVAGKNEFATYDFAIGERRGRKRTWTVHYNNSFIVERAIEERTIDSSVFVDGKLLFVKAIPHGYSRC